MSENLTDFSTLNLPQPLQQALAAMGFRTPTPIQAQAIPAALTRRDLIGCAQTGTGKTAAFGIPVVAQLLKSRDSNALILVPTRELALQVGEVLTKLIAKTPDIRLAVLIGGAAMPMQVKNLSRGARIVVATPGRLCDHLRRGSISLSKTAFLVLDEADRMLDMGFAPQLNEILRFVPKARQTLLFSATLPPDIVKLASKLLRDPVQVSIGEASRPVELIEQKALEVSHVDKNEVLLDQLNAREGSVLIFARTQVRTDRLAKFLGSYGLEVARIHGGRTQGQRNLALKGFKTGSSRILVATDIAARGIDVSHVAHVINYDLPNVPEDYVHRVGRTGRAGKSGEALSLITPDDRANWKEIERLLRRQNAPVARVERAEKPVGMARPAPAPVVPAPARVRERRPSASAAAERPRSTIAKPRVERPTVIQPTRPTATATAAKPSKKRASRDADEAGFLSW